MIILNTLGILKSGQIFLYNREELQVKKNAQKTITSSANQIILIMMNLNDLNPRLET